MKNTKTHTQTWEEQESPYYKLQKSGTSALTDVETLACAAGISVIVSRQLFQRYGGLNEMARLSAHELCANPGIEEKTAASIAAVFEVSRRRQNNVMNTQAITNSSISAEILRPMVGDKDREVFVALFLNRGNRIITSKEMSVGGISTTIIDRRLIFKEALTHLASGIILCHNHPSGNVTPSPQDIKITRELTEAGKVMEIQVLDHIIIGFGNDYYSFADNGMI